MDRRRSRLTVTQQFDRRTLYGSGWRALLRRLFGRPLPIFLSIDRGTDSEETVKVVGVRGNTLTVERGIRFP